jgi:hypothetical protein
VQVIIDAGSKEDAAIIAEALPGHPTASALRGFGLIRLRVPSLSDARRLVPLVATCVEREGLSWARVRIDDELHMCRGRVAKAS